MQPSSIELTPGAVAVIELDQPAAAGFLWRVASLPDCCAIASDEPVEPPAPGLGAGLSIGGSRPVIFLLTAQKNGQGEAVFELARPWEKEPVDQLRLQIAVKEAP